MGRIRALAIAVQRRGCHAVHRPSSRTLVRGRLRRAGKEASGSAVPFGESSLAPPSLLPSVVARLSLLSGTLRGHCRTLAQLRDLELAEQRAQADRTRTPGTSTPSLAT